jgi:hypothetical protein
MERCEIKIKFSLAEPARIDNDTEERAHCPNVSVGA